MSGIFMFRFILLTYLFKPEPINGKPLKNPNFSERCAWRLASALSQPFSRNAVFGRVEAGAITVVLVYLH